MSKALFNASALESVLQKTWGDYIDPIQFMRMVMVNVKLSDFKKIVQPEIPKRQASVTISKIHVRPASLEIWAEYSIPKENGVVIGTQIWILTFTGNFRLDQSFGTFFVPENLKERPVSSQDGHSHP